MSAPGDIEVGRFSVEQRGFDYIPEAERYSRLRELGLFWVAANLNLFFFIVGGVAVSLGLAFWQAIAAILIGNAVFAVIAYSSIAGPRTGLPTMTLSRGAFGVLGNTVNAALAWATAVAFEVINASIGVFAVLALFDELGWSDSGNAGKVIATVLVVGACIGIAVLGHAVMMWFQRVFAVSISVVMVLLFAWTAGDVDWSRDASDGLGGTALLGLFLVACAIIAAGPLSYLFNVADFSRYLPSATPTRRIFWTVYASAALPAIFLGLTGAMIATQGDLADPVGGVKPVVPEWLFVLYAISAIGGSVSNNAPTLYASGLSLQALGVPLRRWRATALDGAISTGLVLYVLVVHDFTSTLNNFLALLNVWIAPFGAIWILDGVLRRWRYDPAEIHTQDASSRYWYTGGANPRAFIALAVGMGLGFLTINATLIQGPLSSLLWDSDLAWLLPPIAAGAVYWALCARALQRERALAASAAPAEPSTVELVP